MRMFLRRRVPCRSGSGIEDAYQACRDPSRGGARVTVCDIACLRLVIDCCGSDDDDGDGDGGGR